MDIKPGVSDVGVTAVGVSRHTDKVNFSCLKFQETSLLVGDNSNTKAFQFPDVPKAFCPVKCRVIGEVYRNGEIVEEPYLYEQDDFQDFGPVEVPPGCLFLMGDYRRNSMDSRDPRVGFVSMESIKGRAFFIFWPLWEARGLSDEAAGR